MNTSSNAAADLASLILNEAFPLEGRDVKAVLAHPAAPDRFSVVNHLGRLLHVVVTATDEEVCRVCEGSGEIQVIAYGPHPEELESLACGSCDSGFVPLGTYAAERAS
jgi:hypothetical protein